MCDGQHSVHTHIKTLCWERDSHYRGVHHRHGKNQRTSGICKSSLLNDGRSKSVELLAFSVGPPPYKSEICSGTLQWKSAAEIYSGNLQRWSATGCALQVAPCRSCRKSRLLTEYCENSKPLQILSRFNCWLSPRWKIWDLRWETSEIRLSPDSGILVIWADLQPHRFANIGTNATPSNLWIEGFNNYPWIQFWAYWSNFRCITMGQNLQSWDRCIERKWREIRIDRWQRVDVWTRNFNRH